MGKSQRTKGANGEREVANMFKEHGIEARRGMGQWQNASNEPDVVVKELPWLWPEVKRGARTMPHAALKQAQEACGPARTPVAICRDDHEKTKVTMTWDFFIRLIKKSFPEVVHQLELPAINDADELKPQIASEVAHLAERTDSDK